MSSLEILTTADVALLAQRDSSTVRWWRKTGQLVPYAVTPRGQALYRRSTVIRFLERRQRRTAQAFTAATDNAA